MQECECIFNSIDFGANEASKKFLRGLLQDSPIEDCRNCILKVAIKCVDRVIKGRGSPIDPSKQAVVNRRLDIVDVTVDAVRVSCGLIIHALIERGENIARQVGSGSGRTIMKPGLQRCDGQQLKLDGEDTEEADEEARKCRRVEDVVEEPGEIDVL